MPVSNQIPKSFKPDEALLKGKVILVTGATGGFGKAVSIGLAKHGATVILLAKNIRLVEAIYDEILAAGYPKPAIYPMDLEKTSEENYHQLADNIQAEFNQLDGLIHCAASLGTPTVFEQSDLTNWHRVFEINLHCAYQLTKVCLPLLRIADKSSLLFMIDDKPGAYWDAYQVSKQALAAMALLLAREYEGGSLTINSFNPGKTKTALQLRAFPAADENDDLPSPADHLNTFLYLMSDQSSEHGLQFSAEDVVAKAS